MDYLKKKELLRKFSERQMTSAELEEFYESVNRGELDADYDHIMAELEQESIEVFIIPAAARDRIESRLHATLYPAKTRSLRWLWKVASVAAVLIAIIGGYRMYDNHEYNTLTHTYTTVTVSERVMKIMQLPDGTKVTLSPGATFRYPKKFGNNARQVFLDQGRGFFDVAKDEERPFTVYSNKLATTVLGTSFIVQNYKEYGYEKISLYTGMVKIDQPGESDSANVVLHPGEEFEKDETHVLVSRFDLSRDPMTGGVLTFSKDRLDVVLYNIANRYGVKLDFKPETMKDQYVTGAYHQGNVEDILKSVAFTHHLSIRKDINPETYTIMKK